MQKRALGLDFGEKTVGVAVSDGFLWTAGSLCVIRRKNETDVSETLEKIASYVKEYDIGDIVLGYPKNMNNTEGPRCEKTRAFQQRLQKKFPNIIIHLFDERLTSLAAERIMLEADLSRKKRGEIIDAMAAAQILQGYLDSRAR